jgi:hypothetical protein
MSTPIFVRTSVSTNNSSTRGGRVANKFAMAAATSSSLWLVEKTRSGLLGKRGTEHRRFRLSDKPALLAKRSEYTASRQRFPRCSVFSRSLKACAFALLPRIIAAVPVVQHMEPRVRCWRVHTHWAARLVVGYFDLTDNLIARNACSIKGTNYWARRFGLVGRSPPFHSAKEN